MKHTRKKFMYSARTVGEVIGRADNYVSEDFIFWRIKELIRNKKIYYRGNTDLMMELEIKKV